MDDDQSFSDILNDLRNPAKRRDPRSIRLAAVTSALVDVAGAGSGDADVSAAKVYAATVTALEGTLQSKDNGQVADSLATQVALLELLHITVPHVAPVAILKATLPLTSRVLRAVVASTESVGADSTVMETKDELGGINALLRWACRASTEVLKRLDATADDKTVKQLFVGTLLTLFRDRRPKVRKAAYNGAIELLQMEDGYACHPAIARSTTAHVHSELSKAQRDKKNQNETLGELLHLLSFLERAIVYLDFAKVGTDIMELLAALFLVDGSSSAADFVAMVKVKEATPKVLAIVALLSTVLVLLEDTSMDRKSALDGFSTRVLASLLQAKPSLVFRNGSSEEEILQRGRTLFGQTILAACQRVNDANAVLACKLTPLAVQVILLLSRPSDEDPDDVTVAETLMVDLTRLFRTKLPALIVSKPQGLDKCLKDLLQGMQQVMQSSHRPGWSVSLKCLVVLLQQLYACGHEFSDCVESLVQLHSEVPSGSPSQLAVRDAVSSLIEGVGVEVFWKWVRWQAPEAASKGVTNGISIDRAWILLTLKSASMAAQPQPPSLSFFQAEVLGLARTCDKLAATIFAERNFHHTRVVELWGLFASFCKRPSDLPSALPSLTTTLARALEDSRYPQLVTLICSGIATLVDSVEDQSTVGVTEGDRGNSDAINAAAVKLLPVMFKIVSASYQSPASERQNNGKDGMDLDEKASSSANDADAQQVQSICDAVSSLARLAPKPFLHGLFKKLMHRLLEEVQSEKGDAERICSLLSLSRALVASEVLDEPSVAFLYRAIKPLIRNDEHGQRVQKRAYKVLAEICERHHSFVTEQDRLKELTDLLTGTIVTSQVAARHMRLKCMNIIVNGFKESGPADTSAIFNVVAEVLLCLKDSNGKTREAAYQLLIAMASLDGMAKLLQTVTAALGAETAHMRSAAVMALSRIVFEFGWENDQLQPLLPSLLRTVLVLIDENSREVIKSVIGFIRISVAAIPSEQLEPLLPDLIDGLMKYQKAKDRFRAKIKIILKKLVRMFGYDALLPFVPKSETRLLTHMRKLDERQKRKKATLKAEGRPDSAKFEDMVDSDEDDSDDGRTLMTGMTRMTARSAATAKSVGDRSSASRTSRTVGASSVATGKSTRTKSDSGLRLPDETDGEVVDMLSAGVRKRVKFADDHMDDSESDDGVMEFDDDGRLVVRDDMDEGATNPDDLNAAPDSMQPHDRRRTSKFETEKAKRADAIKKQGGKRARDLGTSYKSKKAGGDVKRKGQKLEPYAYVPLDGRSYSKKNRRAAVDQMSSVVRTGGKRKKN